MKADAINASKEYLLREQLGYIRQELGEKNEISEGEQFEEALKKLKAGKEVKEKIAQIYKKHGNKQKSLPTIKNKNIFETNCHEKSTNFYNCFNYTDFCNLCADQPKES